MVKKKVVEALESNDVKTKRWKSTFACGRMAYESGEFKQAETLLARAKEMAADLPERSFAENSSEIGIAAVQLATARPVPAKAKLDKVIGVLNCCFDDNHKELKAVAMRFRAQALQETGDAREAEKELLACLEILEKLGNEACVQLAYTLCDLCGLYLSQLRYSEAEQRITRGMLILSKVLGPDAPEYARADMIFAACSAMSDETQLQIAEDGITRMEYVYGRKHPNIARALNRYFKVLEARGDQHKLEEAKERFGLVSRSAK